MIHGDYLALSEFRFLGHIQPNVFFFLTALCVTWLIQLWHDSFVHLDDYLDLSEFKCMYVQVLGRFSKMFVWFWLLHVWHDSFICDMTHSYVTWLIHMWHDSFICDMSLIRVVRIYICDVTHVPGVYYVQRPTLNSQYSNTTHIHLWHDSCTRGVLRGATHIKIPVNYRGAFEMPVHFTRDMFHSYLVLRIYISDVTHVPGVYYVERPTLKSQYFKSGLQGGIVTGFKPPPLPHNPFPDARTHTNTNTHSLSHTHTLARWSFATYGVARVSRID